MTYTYYYRVLRFDKDNLFVCNTENKSNTVEEGVVQRRHFTDQDNANWKCGDEIKCIATPAGSSFYYSWGKAEPVPRINVEIEL